jgi:Biopolymer transport protein
MARKKRTVPGYNAASTADIAFMLLLFFLLTTTMDTDEGLPRKLPPPPDPTQKTDVEVNKRNLLQVMVNSSNQILCAGEEVSLARLREKAIEFIDNPSLAENLPEKTEVEIPFFGLQMTTGENHVISLQCDRGTKYQTYIDVQNELAAAYSDLRNAASIRKFDKDFKSLNDDQRDALIKLYPQKISEAEPKQYGGKK